jgi:hypothetical protein
MPDQHRGARPSGPLAQPADRRVSELDDALRITEVAAGVLPGLAFARDPARAGQVLAHALSRPGHFGVGLVVHALPYLHWYKVQMGDGAGWIRAQMGVDTGLVPVGPRSVTLVPPNSKVLVYQPHGLGHGIILCVLPPTITDARVVCPDWVSQGGQSGLKREEAHKFPAKQTAGHGGVLDWSANRPLDGTAFERGWITPTGLAVLIDDFMVQVRVDETCGLFQTLFDGYCRLAGRQLDVESAIHEERARRDEGEARLFRGVATYPWEALGLYAPGVDFTAEYDAEAVQYEKARGAVDLPEDGDDTQPAYRYVEYGGYEGQGHLRAVVRPARTAGRRRMADREQDVGLFRESVGLDGGYTLASAKRVALVKRAVVTVPREIRPPEHGDGDDAAANNYRFSGQFGTGPEHRVRDPRVLGDLKHLRRVAGVLDLVAYAVNWQALHPFHYHRGDYLTPQERESPFGRTTDVLDFAALADDPYMADPSPRPLRIDHRYGDVDFFRRESFLVLHDDGSVQLGCGFGAQLAFFGGAARLEAPGRLELVSGTDVVVLGSQIVGRAKGSVDFSSSEQDVRLKAEKNMQLVAGNGGQGGILLEAKGPGTRQKYENRIGEDVISSGVVCKAADSVVALLSKDVYARTGGAELGEGDILLDASRGKRRVQAYGSEFNVYTPRGVNFYLGPVEETSTVDKTYHFGDATAVMDVRLLLGGRLIGYRDSGILIDGGVYGTKSFATAGVMADRRGLMLGRVPDTFAGQLVSALDQAAESVAGLNRVGEELHRLSVVEKYYQPEQMGNEALLGAVHFSFRDADDEGQYRTQRLRWAESRWQQLARFGLGAGGVRWAERAVEYQGRELFPWPGRRKWRDEPAFLRLERLTMYDESAGCARDRPGPYEEAALAAAEPVTMEQGFKLIR